MASTNIKDILTSFSPSSELFVISSGDGRIKIWDTLKGQLQTEFADITLTDAGAAAGGLQSKTSGSGHLSLDYKCMQWVPLGNKKKRRAGRLLLVLGTGSGDVLALDISVGELKWKVSDCHPGGVSAVSCPRHGSSVYTAGVDGMICQIDSSTGTLLGKFRSSTKAISSLSVSADGKILASAAGQMKIFSCSDNKKIQKLSGHPVGVRHTIFSEDGKYLLSSGVGERFIALWKIDGSKKQSANCVLSMENPAIFLDCKGSECEGEDGGLYVLAISEMGHCYFWYGKNMEELHNSIPTKISLSVEHSLLKKHKGLASAIYSAKFHDILKPASGLVLVAFGSMVKPSFEKLSVQYGIDINLNSPQEGVLLPLGQTNISQKEEAMTNNVNALDRANAEDALLPLPKLYDFHDKKRKHNRSHSTAVLEHSMADPMTNIRDKERHMHDEVYPENMEGGDITLSMEDRLKSVGILNNDDNPNLESCPIVSSNCGLDATKLNDILSLVGATIPLKKIKTTILSVGSSDALKLLEALMLMWRTRRIDERYVLPWIYGILVNHGRFIMSQASSVQMLDNLHKMTRSKSTAVQPLLQLSGHIQLIMAQIEKVQKVNQELPSVLQVDESDVEDEDIDEFVFGEEDDTSQSSTDDGDLEHQL